MKRGKIIENLKFQGRIPVEYLENLSEERNATGLDSLMKEVEASGDAITESGEEVEIIAEVADKVLIKLEVNHFGKRTYFWCPWEKQLDEGSGRGAVDDVKHVQVTLNGALRAFIDNLKLSGDVMFASKPNAFASGQNRGVYPGKNLELSDEVTDVREALQQFIVQNVGTSYLEFIPFLEKLADRNSNIPDFISGETAQVGEATTKFEANLRSESSGKFMGSIIKNADEYWIEPIVEATYHYNMMEPGQRAEMGNYIVNALGFSSFQNKHLRTQAMERLLALVLSSPELSKYAKFDKFLGEMTKNFDLREEEFLKTEDEINQSMQAQMQQGIQIIADVLGKQPEEVAEVMEGSRDPKDILPDQAEQVGPVEQSVVQKNLASAEKSKSGTEHDKAQTDKTRMDTEFIKTKIQREGTGTAIDINKARNEQAKDIAGNA